MKTALLFSFALAIVSASDAAVNQWDSLPAEAKGGVNALPVYAPAVNGFILWGYRADDDPHYDVEKFDASSGTWSNELGAPPQPKMSRYDPFPTNYRVEFAGGSLRPKPPTPNRPGILASQVCWVPDSSFLFYFWGRKTFVYRPADKAWDTLLTDTSGGYLNTPPGSCMGSLCWDPVNREVVLSGGGYHGISGKSFDINFDPRATWVFSFTTRAWRKLDPGPAALNTARRTVDSIRTAAEGIWADAGQHYMGHADINPANTPSALMARIDALHTFMVSYAGSVASGTGYVRQQLDSVAACVSRAAAFLGQAGTEIGAGNFQPAYWASLDSAKWILTAAREQAEVSPGGRYYGRMVYAGSGKIVLFGGTGDKETFVDTWIYDCAARAWERKSPVNHPASALQCFDFDKRNNVCVAIDGGRALWSYDAAANTWSKWNILLPFTPWDNWNPGVLYMDYDTLDNIHMVLASEQSYGGPARRKVFTLTFDKNTAAAAAASGGPWYRFGGNWPSYRAQAPADTAAWHRFLDTVPVNRIVNAETLLPFTPDERAYGTGTYDADRDQMVLWGGGHSAYMGADVSQFDLNTGRWYQNGPPSFPPYPFGNPDGDGWSTLNGEPGSAHSYTLLGYDNRIKKALLAGSRYFDCDTREWLTSPRYAGLSGISGKVTTTDLKWGCLGFKGYHSTSPSLYIAFLDTATLSWKQVGPALPASITGTTEESRACYDSKRDRVFYYGIGTGGNTKTNETWAFNLSDSTWEKLTPAVYDSAGDFLSLDSLPPKGSYHIWYDTLNDCVFMFASQLYPVYSSIYVYHCSENYWRRLHTLPSNYGSNWGPMIKNVGYSLKRKMFVLAYTDYFNRWGIGIALYKYDPLRLPPVQGTSAFKKDAGIEDGVAASPLPFNPQLCVRYSLKGKSVVRLCVYSPGGRLVRVLENTAREAGRYRTTWDGRDACGRALGSGVYYLVLSTPRFSKQIAVTLVK